MSTDDGRRPPTKLQADVASFIESALVKTQEAVAPLSATLRRSMFNVAHSEPGYVVYTRIGFTSLIILVFLAGNVFIGFMVWYFGSHDVELIGSVFNQPKPDPAICEIAIKSRVVTSAVLTTLIGSTFAELAAAIGTICYWLYRTQKQAAKRAPRVDKAELSTH